MCPDSNRNLFRANDIEQALVGTFQIWAARMVVEVYFLLEIIANPINNNCAFDLYFFRLLNEEATNFHRHSRSQ